MDIAEKFIALDEVIRSGSLCIYGCWFGRPMDNNHRSCSAEFDDEILKVMFDEGEILEVWNPSELVVDGTVLKIPKASKVKWSWHYYGKSKTPENLRHHEYIPDGNRVLSGIGFELAKNASVNEDAVTIY